MAILGRGQISRPKFAIILIPCIAAAMTDVTSSFALKVHIMSTLSKIMLAADTIVLSQ